MTGLVALEVAIGLSFLYLVFSLVVSRINEAVASLLQWRAEGLKEGLRRLLAPHKGGGVRDNLAKLADLTHPLVLPLWTPRVGPRVLGDRQPSYLSPRTFSRALLEILVPAQLHPTEELQWTAELRSRVADLEPGKPAAAERLRQLLPAEGAVLSLEERERFGWAVLGDPDLEDQEQKEFGELLRQLADASTAPGAQLVAAVEQLPEDHPLRAPLLRAITSAAGDLDKIRTTMERIFNETMDRISGWYKRKVQIALTIYAIVLVLALNVDSITLARTLWTDGPVRQAVVAAADQPNQDPATAEEQLRKLVSLALPVGWTTDSAGDPRRHLPDDLPGWLVKLLGLAITVGALSAGAPFWYDTLSKLARLRSSGPPPPSTPDSPTLVLQEPSEAG
jgi:hypothetical protein